MPGIIEFGEPSELSLPVASLPDDPTRNANFRVYMLADVHQKMLNHLRERMDVESGGILVGYPFHTEDEKVKFVVIIGVVPNKSNNRSGVHFTVSPEGAREAREYVEDNYPGMIPVGWYHSHPGLGVFLSGQDMTIVRSIYNAEWNIAWVVDPLRETEGIFYGPTGRPLIDNHKELPLSRPAWIALLEKPECVLKIGNQIAESSTNIITDENSDEGVATDISDTTRRKSNNFLKDDITEPIGKLNRENKSRKITKLLLWYGGLLTLIIFGVIVILLLLNYSGTGGVFPTPVLPVIITQPVFASETPIVIETLSSDNGIFISETPNPNDVNSLSPTFDSTNLAGTPGNELIPSNTSISP